MSSSHLSVDNAHEWHNRHTNARNLTKPCNIQASFRVFLWKLFWSVLLSSTSGRNTCHTTFRSIKKVHTYTLVEIHTFPFRHGHKAESVVYLEVLQHMLFQRDWGRCSLIARLLRHVARTNMFLIYFKILILITVVKHYKFTCCCSQGKDHTLIAMQCSLQ